MVIACATALVLGRMRRLNAATRHTIWWLAVAAVLVLPLVHPDAPLGPSQIIASEMERLWMPTGGLAVPAAPDWLIACGTAIWLGAVVGGVVRIAYGVRRLLSLKARSWPLPGARSS